MSRTTKIRAAIEKLLKVELKEANARGEKIVPYRLNASQIELDLAAENGGKHCILKARQLGISTYIIARGLLKCLTEEGTHVAIISHEKQATIKLLRKAKFFLAELKKEGFEIQVGYDSKSEMTFPEKNSSLYIGTAGQKAFSRGDTLTMVHASEVAFWEGAEELMRGVIGACVPSAEIFLESTANGAGGYFYDICQKSMAAHPYWSKFSQKPNVGGSDWTFHFYPWTDEPLYATDVPPGARSPIWTKDEQELKERHKLTFRQLMWRRNKIGDFKSLDDFLAEFPLTPDEAFIVTGSCYFDKPTLRAYEKLCADPVATGAVEMVGQRPLLNRFAADESDLQIWEFPRPGFSYLIPADASEGIDGEETDESVAPVICRDLYKQVATLAGKIPPLDYADRLYALGAYYNWALIAVEDNGPGLATLLKLIELGYPNIYYHKKLDLDLQREITKPGWHTSAQTRPLMLGQLRSDFKKHYIYPRDRRFLRQCTTFCRQKDGSYKANSGCHDDHVTSMAVGAYIHAHTPMPVVRDIDERSPHGSSGGPAAPPSTSKAGY